MGRRDGPSAQVIGHSQLACRDHCWLCRPCGCQLSPGRTQLSYDTSRSKALPRPGPCDRTPHAASGSLAWQGQVCSSLLRTLALTAHAVLYIAADDIKPIAGRWEGPWRRCRDAVACRPHVCGLAWSERGRSDNYCRAQTLFSFDRQLVASACADLLWRNRACATGEARHADRASSEFGKCGSAESVPKILEDQEAE